MGGNLGGHVDDNTPGDHHRSSCPSPCPVDRPPPSKIIFFGRKHFWILQQRNHVGSKQTNIDIGIRCLGGGGGVGDLQHFRCLGRSAKVFSI